jgi:uncharacterized phage protein (TIGR01671 family)
MKMEIEFRGRTLKGEWVYGYHAKFRNYKNEVYSAIIPKDEETGEAYMEDLHPVIPETVGQYVGIKDKNGKKVYEHDIVEEGDKIGVVKFGEGTFDSGFYRYMGFYYEEENGKIDQNSIYDIDEDWAKIEVIGTVFDKESDNGD